MEEQTRKLYSIGTLWFYLFHKDIRFSDYVSKAMKENLEIINLIDKEKINQYFNSNKDEDLDIIDPDSRTKTLLLLGRKRQTDPFETVINEEEYRSLFNNPSINESVNLKV